MKVLMSIAGAMVAGLIGVGVAAAEDPNPPRELSANKWGGNPFSLTEANEPAGFNLDPSLYPYEYHGSGENQGLRAPTDPVLIGNMELVPVYGPVKTWVVDIFTGEGHWEIIPVSLNGEFCYEWEVRYMTTAQQAGDREVVNYGPGAADRMTREDFAYPACP